MYYLRYNVHMYIYMYVGMSIRRTGTLPKELQRIIHLIVYQMYWLDK